MLPNDYWNKRYLNNETGWDMGQPSPPIVEYFKTISDKNIKILIPGAGNAYEAESLWEMGFNNLYILDFAEEPLKRIKRKIPQLRNDQLILDDFFGHTGSYDIIIEQTFFCALTPNLRYNYVEKMHRLLKKSGELVGLLFNDELNHQKPPFGGSKDEYETLFNIFFTIEKMETAYNSVSARHGRELFIKLRPKQFIHLG